MACLYAPSASEVARVSVPAGTTYRVRRSGNAPHGWTLVGRLAVGDGSIRLDGVGQHARNAGPNTLLKRIPILERGGDLA